MAKDAKTAAAPAPVPCVWVHKSFGRKAGQEENIKAGPQLDTWLACGLVKKKGDPDPKKAPKAPGTPAAKRAAAEKEVAATTPVT